MPTVKKKIGEELEQAFRFTEVYKAGRHEHPAIREANCLKVQFPYSLAPIEPGDLFAGRYRRPLVRFTQHACDELGYCADEKALLLMMEDPALEPADHAGIEELIRFWRLENTAAKVRDAYPPGMEEALPSDNWIGEPGIAFPLYRICGASVNFDMLLRLGIPGLKGEVKRHRKPALQSGGDAKLHDGMLEALDLLSDCCLYYAGQAEQMSRSVKDPARRLELAEMAAVLVKISGHRPETFREAIQLFWLYALLSGVRNYGRTDVYLGDFLANDLHKGILTERRALEYVQSLWRLMASLRTIFENRVIIGGMGRRNEKNADRFAMLAMEATRTVTEAEPQLSLRFYAGMDGRLLDKALEVIAEGRTYPILYNDDTNVPAVERAFEVSRDEALQYVPFGCGEYILDHRSLGTPSGVLNMLKALEAALRNGRDALTGRLAGLPTGEPEELEKGGFERLKTAYERQVEHFVNFLARQEELEYWVAGREAAYLYTSLLYDGCLESGKAVLSGGIPYLGGTLETYGNINAADSLTAIKELVFERKTFTLEHIVKMLDADFAGYEKERKEFVRAPKFGNDDDKADEMARYVHDHACRAIREQKERTALHSYLNVVINNQANTLLGRWTGASADGRRAGRPMANGNTPSGGSDRKGMTALLNSIVKLGPAIHAGAVHNLKCGRELLAEQQSLFKAVLFTYFAKGGTQLMITVVNRSDLEQAIIHPENYPHLFVRVGGFSARFVELPPDVQQEILSRTLY